MGTGCIHRNSSSHPSFTRTRAVRLGNLNLIIYETRTVGKGCKKTPAWETSSTRDDVNKKIEEFWDTRIGGNPDVWKILRSACDETIPENAKKKIKDAGISMFSGSLMLTFDCVGYRYDLPVYVISEATKYGIEKIIQQLPEDFEGKILNVMLRCSKFADEKLDSHTGELVGDLKSRYGDKVVVSKENIRMFFNGKEMKNDMTLHHCGVRDGVVLQVYL